MEREQGGGTLGADLEPLQTRGARAHLLDSLLGDGDRLPTTLTQRSEDQEVADRLRNAQSPHLGLRVRPWGGFGRAGLEGSHEGRTAGHLDDTTGHVTTEEALRALAHGLQVLTAQRAQLALDYDLNERSPHLDEKTRAALLTTGAAQLRDCQWRIDEIERRRDAANDAAKGQ